MRIHKNPIKITKKYITLQTIRLLTSVLYGKSIKKIHR